MLSTEMCVSPSESKVRSERAAIDCDYVRLGVFMSLRSASFILLVK